MMNALILSILLLAAATTDNADRLFSEGKWSEARTAYEAALKSTGAPKDRAVILDRIGETLLYEGKLWRAESRFAESIEVMETGLARLHRGQAYFRAAVSATGDPSALGAEVRSLLNDAANQVRRSIELLPESADARIALGLVERYRSNVEEEVKALRDALRIAPGHPEAALHLAWRLEVQRNYAEALKVLESVEAKARGVDHWLATGRVVARIGSLGESASAYTEAALLDPESWDAFAGIWNATALEKKFGAFDKAAARVLKRHENAWLAHYYLGFSKLDNGDPEAAVKSFARSVELKPDLTRARVMIAQIHRENLGLEEDSIRIYSDVLEREPGNSRARAAIAAMAMSRAVDGRHEAAGRLFEILRKADPGNPVHTMNLALAKKELGLLDEALALYEEIEKEFPFEPQIPNDRGLLLMGMGRTEEAMAAFQVALDRDPDFLDTLENLGGYARLHGDFEAALEWFKKAYDRVRREGGDTSKFRRYLDLTAAEIRERE